MSITRAVEALAKRKRSVVGGRRRKSQREGDGGNLALLVVGLEVGDAGPDALAHATHAAGEALSTDAIATAKANSEGALDLSVLAGTAWLEGFLVHAVLTRLQQDHAAKSFSEHPFSAFIGTDGTVTIPREELAGIAESLRW